MADKSNLIAQLGGSGTGYFPDNNNKDITPQRLRDYLTLLINNSLFVDDNFSNDVDELTSLTSKAWSIQAIKDYVAGTGGVSSGIQVTYEFDTGTTAGAGSGEMRLNNATPASATLIYFNDTSSNGDASGIISSLTAASQIIFQDPTDIDTYQVFDVTDVPTDLSGEWSVPVQHASGGGTTVTDGNDVSVLMGLGSQGFNHVLTQNLDAQSNKIINLDDGTASGDAVNLSQLEAVQALIEILRNGTQTLAVSANAITWNLATDSPLAEVELDANVTTFTISNQNDHTTIHLVIKQDATGSRTMVAPTGYTATGGSFDINSNGNSYTLATFVKTTSYQVASTDYDGTGGSGSTIGDYTTWSALLLDQAGQTEGLVYRADDASGHADITTGYAYFEYLGTSVGDETDYNIIAAEEDRARITAVEDELPDKVDKTTVVINEDTSVEYTSIGTAITAATAGDTLSIQKNITTTTQINLNKAITINTGGNIITNNATNGSVSSNHTISISANGAKIVGGGQIRRVNGFVGSVSNHNACIYVTGDDVQVDTDIVTEGQSMGVWGSGADNFVLNGGMIQLTDYTLAQFLSSSSAVINGTIYCSSDNFEMIAYSDSSFVITQNVYLPLVTGLEGGQRFRASHNGYIKILGNIDAPLFEADGLLVMSVPGDDSNKDDIIEVHGIVNVKDGTVVVAKQGRNDPTTSTLRVRKEDAWTNGIISATRPPDTIEYILPAGSSGGGIEEAPEDGTPYARQDADWVPSPGGSGEANTLASNTTAGPYTNGTIIQLNDAKTGTTLNLRSILVQNRGLDAETYTNDSAEEQIRMTGAPWDEDSDYNVYFSTDDVAASTGTYLNPIDTNGILLTRINDNSESGDTVTIWITGSGSNMQVLDNLPLGRNYRFKPYGSESIIDGSEEAGTWVNVSGDVWRYSESVEVKGLLIDNGSGYVRGNMSTDGNEYLIDAITSGIIESAAFDAVYTNSFLAGTKVDFKNYPYNMARGSVTINVDENLLFDDARVPDSTLSSIHDMYFQLYGHPDWLAANDDWCYDSVNDFVYIYSDTDPNAKDIKVIKEDYGISIDGTTENISIYAEGITIQNVAIDAVFAKGRVNNATFKLCTGSHIGRYVFTIFGVTNHTLNVNNIFEYNTFTDVGAGLLWLAYPYKPIIRYNTFTGIDSDEHIGFTDSIEGLNIATLGNAIHFYTGSGVEDIQAKIYNNTIQMPARAAINSAGAGHIVEKNYLTQVGRLANDCGAIYIGGDFNYHQIWKNNILFNPYPTTRLSTTNRLVVGLYVDNQAYGATMENNYVHGFSIGAQINYGGVDCTLEKNHIGDCDTLIVINHKFNSSVNPCDRIRVTENTFYPNHGQLVLYMNADFDLVANPVDFGYFDNNTVKYFWQTPLYGVELDGFQSIRVVEGQGRESVTSLLGYEANTEEIFYPQAPEYLIDPDGTITDDFTETTIDTSEDFMDYGGDVYNVNLSGGNAVIPDGTLVELEFDAYGSVDGLVIDARIQTTGNVDQLIRFIKLGASSSNHKLHWLNDSGGTLTLTRLNMRTRGFDGNTRSITFTDFSASYQTTPGSQNTFETIYSVDRVPEEGPFILGDGTTKSIIDTNVPTTATTNDPKVLIDNKR